MVNLLYTSCHPWLERSDLFIYNSLGFNTFSTGYFQDPRVPTSPFVQNLDLSVNPTIYEEFKALNPNYTYGYTCPLKLTKDFLKPFDVIVVTWRYDYLYENLNIFKDKLVIFQTVGQSSPQREKELCELRKLGVKVVRISELEKNFPNYAGHDAIIDLAIDTTLFKPWTGTDPYILSVNKMMYRTQECNVNLYLKVTDGFPRKLYGTGNTDFHYDFNLGPIDPSNLIDAYSKARVVFSLGTKPAPITLSFKEAMAAGCPVITWGPVLGNGPYKTYAAYEFITNGENGFYADTIPELRGYIQDLLDDYSLATSISEKAKLTAETNFSLEYIASKWKDFFISMGVL